MPNSGRKLRPAIVQTVQCLTNTYKLINQTIIMQTIVRNSIWREAIGLERRRSKPRKGVLFQRAWTYSFGWLDSPNRVTKISLLNDLVNSSDSMKRPNWSSCQDQQRLTLEKQQAPGFIHTLVFDHSIE